MRRPLLIAALALALSTSAFADTGDPSNIVGGTPAPAGKWPDTVAVLGGQGACTGTLIAPDVVLTAGHCIEINPDVVIANTLDYAGPGGEQLAVAQATAYPNWENTYDVGVVVLAEPSTVTPREVGTDCTFATGFNPGTNVQLVGFGATDEQGQAYNTLLNEGTAQIQDPLCSGGDGCNPGVAPGGEFVAGGAVDSCFGDSGGPVYLPATYGMVVIGVVSRGINSSPTPCGGGGIYVRTDKVVPWIEQTTGKTIAKTDCNGADPGDPDDPGDPSDPSDPSGPSDPDDDDDGGAGVTGGCAAAPGAGLPIALVIGALVARRRRRR